MNGSHTGDSESEKESKAPLGLRETFDLIITDECHRFIYILWRQVL
jgi:type I site-specific restriction endonuclease